MKKPKFPKRLIVIMSTKELRKHLHEYLRRKKR